MNEQSLPAFNPESFELLKMRYHNALTEVLDVANDNADDRHRFDFYDGMRMIVSRDQVDDDVFLHLSASAVPGSQLYLEIKQGSCSVQRFCRLTLRRFKMISDDQGPFTEFEITQTKRVPHWRRKE